MSAHNESESSSRHGTLILTRHIGETLVIGDQEIKVTVLGIKGKTVRFAIQADKNVPIDRFEIHQKKKAGIPAPR